MPNKKYYQKNKMRCKMEATIWRLENHARWLAYRRKWNKLNADKCRMYRKRYNKKQEKK